MFRKLTEPCGLHCIKMNGIGVTLGDQEILRDVNLHIHCGTLAAVIGKNGAGKTTLIRAILGDVPHTGDIEFTIHNLNGLSPEEVDAGDDTPQRKGSMKLRVGYVPQSLNIDKKTPLSVYDMIACYQCNTPVFLLRDKSMEAKIRESLAVFDAEDLIDQQVCNLSGGQLQRVLLAMAILDAPDLLLLDEPVSGIDADGLETFYRTISRLTVDYDLAVILVSHDLADVARYADQVILLDGGEVACQGSVRQVYESPAFTRIFGHFDVDALRRPDEGRAVE